MHDQAQRYARQMILPGFGDTAQARLRTAKVAVVGAGGLGSPVLYYLAAAGVGHITLIDGDRVALSNLHRQILFETADVTHFKAEAAQQSLNDLNPDCEVSSITQMLDDKNATALLQGHDLVLDTSDRVATRLAVNRACVTLSLPLVSAAVAGWHGQVYYFTGQPCYACLYPDIEPGTDDTACSEAGILGSTAGIVGSWQALWALQLLAQVGTVSPGNMLILDANAAQMRHVKIERNPSCSVCS